MYLYFESTIALHLFITNKEFWFKHLEPAIVDGESFRIQEKL